MFDWLTDRYIGSKFRPNRGGKQGSRYKLKMFAIIRQNFNCESWDMKRIVILIGLFDF